ncbi:MAG: hypothetical protein V4488_06200 [Pseudomonadota bacterium]
MSTKALFKLATTALFLSYPLLAHWVLPRWHAAPALLLMLPPSALNAMLAWFFGRTLLGGREPIISSFARIEQASLNQSPNMALPADLVGYTRTLTKIWSALFVAMALFSALLAWSGMYTWWALFTGLISYLLMAALFLGEYLFRRLRFAHHPHAQPFQLMWFLIKSGPIWMRGR